MTASPNYYLSDSTDKQAILALMQSCYPDYLYNQNYFQWQYLDNPTGEAKIFLAAVNGRVIGQYVLVPHLLEDYRLWRVQDVMIHPHYRKQGIFYELMDFACKGQHWTSQDLFWAFPNESSFPFFLKQGFSIHSKVCFWELTSSSRAPELSYTQTEAYATCIPQKDFSFVDSIFFTERNDYVCINKSASFLTWRYLQKPLTQYEIFSIEENECAIGYLVLKKYTNAEKETSLHICELRVKDDDYDAIKYAILFAMSIKKQENAQILNTFASSPTMERVLVELCFVQKQTDRNIVFHYGRDRTMPCPYQASEIMFSLGDNDIY